MNFTLVKGDKGDRGIQGIQGLTGNGISSIRKTGTDGLVDTYTITYTNGNTTTFTITNGEDGEVTETELDVLRQNDTELKNDISKNADEITNLKNENSYLQNVVKQAFTEKIASGTELNIDNTIEARMNLKLNGNTSQNGEPTPNTPQEIHCVKGNNVVKVTNQNLFDGIFRQGTHISSVTSNRIINKNILEAKIGKTYTISTNLPSIYKWKITNNEKHEIANSVRTINDTTYSSTSSVTVNCTENGYLRVLVARVDDNNITPNDIVGYKFQVEQGSTATSYVTHKETDYKLNLGNIELNAIEDFKDYFKKEKNKWYKVENIGSYTFKGNEDFHFAEVGTINQRFDIKTSALNIACVRDQRYKLFTHFRMASSNSGIWGEYYMTGDWLVIKDNDNKMTSLEDFKAWLSANKPTIYYARISPIDIEITDITLITQLDEISQVLSQKGTTIISQNNDDLPFNLDVIALTK